MHANIVRKWCFELHEGLHTHNRNAGPAKSLLYASFGGAQYPALKAYIICSILPVFVAYIIISLLS